jgi:hypothetical protein
MIPPVGKSGPFYVFHQSFYTDGLIIDVGCDGIADLPEVMGGMLVAIPTAIPLVPFARRKGKAAGRTFGSFKESS